MTTSTTVPPSASRASDRGPADHSPADLFDTAARSGPGAADAPPGVPAPGGPRRGRPVGRPAADDAARRSRGGRPVRSTPRPPGPPPSRSVVSLLEASRDGLREAQTATTPADRFRSAHLAALRAAAAVLAVRARSRRAGRPTDAWTLLTSVAPEYGEWAAFFAAHSATRSAVEAGARRLVAQRDADDMVRQADLFLALVTRTVAGQRDRP